MFQDAPFATARLWVPIVSAGVQCGEISGVAGQRREDLMHDARLL